MQNEAELKKIATGIRSGSVTVSTMIANADVLTVFRSMRNVTLGELEEWESNGIHVIYEWNDKSIGDDDDGKPVFDTYQFLKTDEWMYIEAEIERLDEKAKKRNIRKLTSQKRRKKK